MKVVVGISIFLAGFVFLFFVSELYVILRKRINKPKIGDELLINLLNKGDYVSIQGKVHRFSHIARENEKLNLLAFPSESNNTIGGELAFANDHRLGFVFFYPSVMANCDFIYGKYGLKWARNKAIANIANEQIKKYWYE